MEKPNCLVEKNETTLRGPNGKNRMSEHREKGEAKLCRWTLPLEGRKNTFWGMHGEQASEFYKTTKGAGVEPSGKEKKGG